MKGGGLPSHLRASLPLVERQWRGGLTRALDGLTQGGNFAPGLKPKVCLSSAVAMPAALQLQHTPAWLSSKSVQGRKNVEGWRLRSMALRSRERDAKHGGDAQSTGGAGGRRGGGEGGAEFHVEPLDPKADPDGLKERLRAAIAGTDVSILNVRIPRTPPSLAKSRYAVVTVGSQEEAMRAIHALNSLPRGSTNGSDIKASLPTGGSHPGVSGSNMAKSKGSSQNGGGMAHQKSTEESLMNLLAGNRGAERRGVDNADADAGGPVISQQHDIGKRNNDTTAHRRDLDALRQEVLEADNATSKSPRPAKTQKPSERMPFGTAEGDVERVKRGAAQNVAATAAAVDPAGKTFEEVKRGEAEESPVLKQPKMSGRQAKQRKSDNGKEIRLVEGMTIKGLSDAVGVRLVEVIKQMIRLGESPKTINDAVSVETAELIVTDLGMSPVLPEGAESTRLGRMFSDDEYAALPERPPIVTIMGHVDHGKTTLLDYFRNSSVAAGEAGGITQSIAAFEVERPGLGRICFVDTPGHKAFSAMRERGARATDIVILVVSAVDGVQPQTLEVIQHARAMQVPIIIAVNKCDLPRAEPSMVLTALASEGVVVEELGGDVQSVEVSALTGMNISSLEEGVLLLASMMELRAPSDGPSEGFVVESRKDKALGPVASVIVTLGELKVGDHVVVGGEWGRVRALKDCNRVTTDSVGPSRVCEVIGFRGQPAAGEELYVVESEKAAVAHAERNSVRKSKSVKLASAAPLSGGNAHARGSAEEEEGVGRKELPIIVKADSAGSLEALVGSLMALPSHEVAIQIVHAEIGPVTEYDVDVASGVGARIYTFNCKDPTNAVTKAAKAQKVCISNTKIIYTLLEEVTDHMIDLLPSVTTTEILGEAEVLQMFEIKGKGSTTMVAGCKVVEGTMMQKCTHVQVIRSGEVVHEGALESLRHHKDVVKEVRSGNECGIVIERFEAIEVGDEVHCIDKIVTKRTSL